MIRPLRKRHFQIWSALGVLIPAGIVTAWLSVTHPGHTSLLQPVSVEALPKVISSAETADYIIRLRSSDSSAEQLEWINKKILTVPSAVIYQSVPGGKEFHSAELIGRIEARGSYYFPLRRDSIHQRRSFILYDFIHEKIIDSINLQP